MKTTLQKIWDKDPCFKNDDSKGWALAMKNAKSAGLNIDDLSTEVSLMQILESNGIKDAIWALRCFDYFDYRDYCLFLADVAESVLRIYEKINKSEALRKLIQAIRDHKAGLITREELGPYVHAVAHVVADDRKEKWQEIEALFINHFGEKG